MTAKLKFHTTTKDQVRQGSTWKQQRNKEKTILTLLPISFDYNWEETGVSIWDIPMEGTLGIPPMFILNDYIGGKIVPDLLSHSQPT